MKLTDRETLPASRISWFAAVVVFWIVTAALTGFLHSVELLVTRHAFGRLAWYSREFVWMSPIAYAVFLAPGAFLLALLAAVAQRTWALAFSAAALATVGAFGLLLPYSQVSRISSLILALGVGVMVGRAVYSHPAPWIRRSRTAAFICASAVAVLIPAQRGMVAMREARALAALPSAPSSPNVLVIILDTMRAASMSLYDEDQPSTPRLEEWSQTGTVFDWAFAPAPWTLPSHSSMFTGVWPGEQSGDWETSLDRTLPTLAERLRDRGYLTGGFVANMHYTAWDSGLHRGFTHYEDYLVNWGQLMQSSSYTQTTMYAQIRAATSAGEVVRRLMRPNLHIGTKHRFEPKHGDAVTDAFLGWQASHPDRPFFAFLNYFDTHAPYYAPPQFRKFTGERGHDRYLAAAAFVDSEIDRILDTLRERGVLDNTLVIVTSDHGELFDFKGLSGHAHNLYVNTLRVPLFLRLPGRVPPATRIARPVTLRDLPATILDLVAPGAEPLPGSSLALTWTGAGEPSPVLAQVTKARNVDSSYPTSRGDLQMLLDEPWQLIVNSDGAIELYDYRADPGLAANLALGDSSVARVAAMRQRLQELLRVPR